MMSVPAFPQNAAPTKADILLTNARVYTVNAAQPWASAVAIQGEKILAVGDARQIEKYRGPSTKVVDAGGRLVLPGFVDCHIHFMEGSLGLEHVILNGSKDVAELQKRVKDYADSHPHEAWITGMGWTYPTFGAAALPNKKILDDVVPDRPVFLSAFDGHSSWANSKALELAKITRDTPDPPNGKIVRDANGEPTGALKEAAGELVSSLIPKPTREQRLEALRLGMHEANKVGLTRVHSAGGDFEWLSLYDELRKQGELSLRFYVAYFLDPPELTADNLEKIEWARRTYHDDWISGGVVKTMLDGVIEAHTAAMLAPYSDDPTQTGHLFWDPVKYKQALAELDKRGIQIFTHAIGDYGVRTALDGYENMAKVNHTTDARPRVEHIETISKQDIPRFGKLGVIASFQPLHAYPDEDTLEIWARNTGPERATRAWVWQSIEKSGGKLAFGSDWPVVTLNPWEGMQNALTRKTREGTPAEGFVPSERVSLEDTIQAYTLGAAFAGRREKTEGSIEAGKLADLIIVSQDLFKVPASETANTKVLLTMVGGKVVYRADSFAADGSASPSAASSSLPSREAQ
ncbi:MAG: amidohydrolase [Acidobacteria bacterium]|jgi:predicted amidohydrolase YtcJ|nr:amidohydrolase [Acidobacteriota bacterium]